MMQLPDFSQMCEMYREWNARINVISRKDVDNVYEHHILHSLCIAFYLQRRLPQEFLRWQQEGGGVKVLDVGCGGGFPGIPLAYVFPNVEFTLCDSIGKKTLVASQVASSLGLKNVQVVNSRAEQLGGRWDWAVSRAVTSLDNYIPWVEGKLSRGILYLKGGDLSGELLLCDKKFPGKIHSVDIWKVSEELEDEYFKEKLVVNLGI